MINTDIISNFKCIFKLLYCIIVHSIIKLLAVMNSTTKSRKNRREKHVSHYGYHRFKKVQNCRLW